MLPLNFRAVAHITQDSLLREVYHHVQHGWPLSKLSESDIQLFLVSHESISMVDGCVSSPIGWSSRRSIPAAPWQRVHVNYAGPIEGEYYLFRGLFAQLGLSVILLSDNGSQFTSVEFADICAFNGIEHLTTAPLHP